MPVHPLAFFDSSRYCYLIDAASPARPMESTMKRRTTRTSDLALLAPRNDGFVSFEVA